MKLFIKKFSRDAGVDTWWVYFAKNGQGLAIRVEFNYIDAKTFMINHKNDEEQFFMDIHRNIIDQHLVKKYHHGRYDAALVVTE